MVINKNIILLGKTKLGDKQYTLSDSAGTILLKKNTELPDNWYGGTVKELRKTKDSNILMCIDKKDRVINLAYMESELTNNDKQLLGIIGEAFEDIGEVNYNATKKRK